MNEMKRLLEKKIVEALEAALRTAQKTQMTKTQLCFVQDCAMEAFNAAIVLVDTMSTWAAEEH